MESAKLKLYIFTHEFFPKRGGIATVVEEVALLAQKKGHFVTVFAPDINNIPHDKYPFALVPLNNRGTQGYSCQFKTIRILQEIFKSALPDVLYIAEPGALQAVMKYHLFNSLRGVRLCITFHGSELVKLSGPGMPRLLLEKLLKKATSVTVLSTFCEALFCKHFPKHKSKLHLTPGGCRTSGRILQACSMTNAEHSQPKEVLLLTVGRIHPRKNQALIIEALAHLKNKQNLLFKYQVVGPIVDKKYHQELTSRAEALGVNVEFLGEVNDDALDELYQKASYFVMVPKVYKTSVEGYGLVYLDAMVRGLPVIATDTGGVGDIVKDGETGLLLPDNGDSTVLAQAILKLEENPELRNRIITQAMKEAQGRSWLGLVESLVGG